MRRQYVCVIQAGGKGSRMKELTHDLLPKPLLKINGIPMIEWQILALKNYLITDFIIIVGHLGNLIQEYFGDGSKWNVKISYIYENIPLGSGGALFNVKQLVNDKDLILVFGDVMFDVNWDKVLDFHENNDSLVTLLAHPNSHPYDSDILILDEHYKVVDIDSKSNIRDYYYKNCVNTGLSVIKLELLAELNSLRKLDFEAELIKPVLKSGRVYAYCTPEYIKDAGTPERFRQACEEQEKGIWERKSLKNKQCAIFIDRDGTINEYKGFINNVENFQLIANVDRAIKRINGSKYLAIVVTNQPVVARGECTVEELSRIHMKMETELGEKGAYVDDLFVCMHHPDKGYEGEVPQLKIVCKCRKPNIGMLSDAAAKYNIDLEKSWFIGDTTVDIQTGINANVRTVLVKTGEAGMDKKYNVQPNYIANTLSEAVDLILGKI